MKLKRNAVSRNKSGCAVGFASSTANRRSYMSGSIASKPDCETTWQKLIVPSRTRVSALPNASSWSCNSQNDSGNNFGTRASLPISSRTLKKLRHGCALRGAGSWPIRSQPCARSFPASYFLATAIWRKSCWLTGNGENRVLTSSRLIMR